MLGISFLREVWRDKSVDCLPIASMESGNARFCLETPRFIHRVRRTKAPVSAPQWFSGEVLAISNNGTLMTPSKHLAVYFHIHLVSDATGETLNAMSKAACAQFEGVKPIEHVYALVRSPRQLDRALAEIEAAPGVVFYTIMNTELRERLEARCQELNTPCLSVLDPVLSTLRSYLGTELTHKMGGQHAMNSEYFDRIEALNFTMAHDDGQQTHNLNEADVILVGVSRTSKTPTCIYLANRGIKAANVPVVADVPLPPELEQVTNPLVVGLTVGKNRLVQIRRNRLLSLKADTETRYVDDEEVRKEIVYAQRLFEKHKWPTIDVSRRSIEETAAAVLNLLSQRQADRSVTIP